MGGSGAVSASLGRAGSLGALSVPQSWATTASAMSPPLRRCPPPAWAASPKAGRMPYPARCRWPL
ncbi:polymorphic PE/PPE family protein [Mycobacterium xenopi 3993]|nr:polymorphic PE/PPE family protein [Mycobacterium xenopi 3993]